MTNEKQKTSKCYSEMTAAERFEKIKALYEPITKSITTTKIMSIEDFFINLHNLGKECDKFIQHYFNQATPEDVINNVDILNEVNKIQLMIKVR